MKKILIITGLLLLITGTSSWAMSKDDTKEAIQTGYKAAEEKQDFVYNEGTTFQLTYNEGFFGHKKQLKAEAYLLSPYCTVATYAAKSKENHTSLDDSKTAQYSEVYTAMIIYKADADSIQEILDPKITGIQDGITIQPIETVYGKVQIIDNGWSQKMAAYGVMVRFNFQDIDSTKPLIIKTKSAASREFAFTFQPKDYGIAYQFKTSDYKF
ncbi:Hypothetical protein LUCI_4403 [Lucifera butyrica]|uniref:Uncharacterized protein n=1 Tax=Lucifera butyrica TaxID=1351585 RepID=A0A498RDW4_9FIRM|nr:hypothetical protein [Lucifera butyrica]VBB09117.1 Hypothetical protein LUCI_4403 [Lucifera butyrica]